MLLHMYGCWDKVIDNVLEKDFQLGCRGGNLGHLLGLSADNGKKVFTIIEQAAILNKAEYPCMG